MSRTPSVDVLVGIVETANRLIQTARETFSVADQIDPPGYPITLRIHRMVNAIRELEAFNQTRTRLGQTANGTLIAGWSEKVVTGMGSSMRWWRNAMIHRAVGKLPIAAVSRRVCSTETSPSAVVKEKCVSALELRRATPRPSSRAGGRIIGN